MSGTLAFTAATSNRPFDLLALVDNRDWVCGLHRTVENKVVFNPLSPSSVLWTKEGNTICPWPSLPLKEIYLHTLAKDTAKKYSLHLEAENLTSGTMTVLSILSTTGNHHEQGRYLGQLQSLRLNQELDQAEWKGSAPTWDHSIKGEKKQKDIFQTK